MKPARRRSPRGSSRAITPCGALACLSLLVSSCARPPPPTRRSLEAPRYPALQGRVLKVEVVDFANFLGGDPGRMAALHEQINGRLASRGVTISADAHQTLRLELSSSQQPARGDEWCVHVSGAIDTRQPAFLPRQQAQSVRCAAITRVEMVQGLGLLFERALKAATGAASEELARSRAVALADCVEDVLDQVGANPGS